VADRSDEPAPKGDVATGYSRRDLAKLSALTAAAVAVPFVIANQTPAKSPKLTDWIVSDILVIGSGFAGVFAALEARKLGHHVVMVDKGSVGWSGLSPWASDSRPFDPRLYSAKEWHDNLSLNCEWLYNRRWVDIFIEQSLSIFEVLKTWGCHECHPFERSKIFRKLLEDAGVQIVERLMVTDLLQDPSGRVNGAVGFHYDDSAQPVRLMRFAAQAVISCMGAGAYKSPGFPNWGQTFDGDALAFRAGAWITGKEFHDTHPTVSNTPAASYDGWRWAQSVKGAYIMVGPPDRLNGGLGLGGALKAHLGQLARVPGGGPGGEPPVPPGSVRPLSPYETSNHRYAGKGFLADPRLILDYGAPPETDHDPDVIKAQGFRVGGATAGMGVHKGEGVYSSDYSCAADEVPGLFVAGDALGSMMCGPLYPGRGFSSYGSAIQGQIAGRNASQFIRGANLSRPVRGQAEAKCAALFQPRERKEGFSPAWVTQVLRNTMSPLHILYIKDARRLDGALASIEYLRQNVVPHMVASDGHDLRVAHEADNMLLNAEMKLRAGLFRTESRGTHFREDHPMRDDDQWFCWVVLKQAEGGGMQIEKRPLPDAWRPPASMTYRDKYPRIWPGEDRALREQGKI
jgi:succinate dehydrogenase/fumarate reductase flavoprotein subunit